jgi:type III secretion protein T
VNELALAVAGLQPHVVAVALIGARLVPVAFLCPLLGGSHAPTHVKLGVVLALAGSLHGAGGIMAPSVAGVVELAALGARELLFGVALGLIASLPFDAARMGGRFIDLFRGSSAEAALPMAGTKEAATGDALYHLLLALGAAGGLSPLLLGALFRSYSLVPVARPVISEAIALSVAQLVSATFSTGFALGAPIAALALTIDLGLGLASRAAPQMSLQEPATPLRILAGGALLWLTIGLLAARLQDFAAGQFDTLETVSRLSLGT